MRVIAAALMIASISTAVTAQKVRPVMRPPASVSPQGRAARATAQAAEPIPQEPLTALPSFRARGLDGKAVSAETLPRNTHWILLYTRDHCEPCDKVVATLAGSQSSGLKRGAPFVVVVGKSGTYAALDAARAKYPNLADATWLEDSAGEAVAALKPTGSPMLYAMRGSQVAWTIPGGLDSPATVEKLVSGWLTKEDAGGAPAMTVTAAASAPASKATPAAKHP